MLIAGPASGGVLTLAGGGTKSLNGLRWNGTVSVSASSIVSISNAIAGPGAEFISGTGAAVLVESGSQMQGKVSGTATYTLNDVQLIGPLVIESGAVIAGRMTGSTTVTINVGTTISSNTDFGANTLSTFYDVQMKRGTD